MRILVVLQNPYAKGSLVDGWNPSRWRREFEMSRSGRRLRNAFPDRCTINYTNANPKLGDGPDSKLDADLKHLKRKVREITPDLVVSCGKIAEEAMLDVWDGPFIAIPHPASRTLTNRLLDECKQRVIAWKMCYLGINDRPPQSRIALRQMRGSIKIENFSEKADDTPLVAT